MSVNYLWKAKAVDGYIIKQLSEVIQFYIKKKGRFYVCPEYWGMEAMDSDQTVLVDFRLKSDNFQNFVCKKPMLFSINLLNAHKLIKQVKRKDTVILYITSQQPNKLYIKIESNENKRSYSVSSVVIQETQEIQIKKPLGYDKPINIPGGDFQKMCRGMDKISKTLEISKVGKNMIRFYCDGKAIMDREAIFGEEESDDESDVIVKPVVEETEESIPADEDVVDIENDCVIENENENETNTTEIAEETENIDVINDEEQTEETKIDTEELKEDLPENYSFHFSTPLITKLSKLTANGRNVKVYLKGSLPIKFVLTVGSLGEVAIYIKSDEKIASEREEEQPQAN